MRKLYFFIFIVSIFSCGNNLEKVQELDENGNIAVEYYLNEKGEYEGEYTTFHSNGNIKTVTMHADGKYNGPFKEYYQSGKLYQEVNFLDGLPNGVRKIYYESGKIKWKVNLKNNIEDGFTYRYFENGELENISLFYRGEVVYQKKYDKNRNVLVDEKRAFITNITNFRDTVFTGSEYCFEAYIPIKGKNKAEMLFAINYGDGLIRRDKNEFYKFMLNENDSTKNICYTFKTAGQYSLLADFYVNDERYINTILNIVVLDKDRR